ncbi:MAG: T9SS type A sorting domain-containing protein [Candidatus Cloacimonetes bacterium]|nr:T9SS type A sorting domain-containing protein [Candidatus Cloacimonadota bacterium]
MKICMTVVILALMATLGAASLFTCLDDTDTATTIEFTTPAFKLTPETQGMRIDLGEDYPPYGAGLPGQPDVPLFSRLVRIPAGASVELTLDILDEETLNDVLLLPCRDLDAIKSGNNDYPFDDSAYTSTDLLPVELATVGEPGIMREAALVRITVQPFRYRAATRELHVARRMQLTLRYTYAGRGAQPKVSGRSSQAFTELLDAVIVNPLPASRSYNNPGSYIYIYNGDAGVVTWLQPLLDWRQRQGYEVHLISMDSIGTSNIAIKGFLQTAYDTWSNPPEFVCLVGDGSMNYTVPTFYESYTGETVYGDHPYTLLDGDDVFPEILIGRLTFSSLTQLQTIVMKILHYEIDPPTDNPWLDRALLLADPYDSGSSTITTMLYILGLLEDYNPGGEYPLVLAHPLVNRIRNELNTGVGAYFYRGFGNFSNWTSQYTHDLVNYDMTPFMSALTCYTGDFANGNDCDVEVFLKAGTPSQRIGAVGVIGSSSATHTCFNNIITGGIAQSIYVEGMRSFAAALNRGKLALYEAYPSNPNEFVDWYTIGKSFLGDPGTWLRTRSADSLFVSAPATIPLGSTAFEVVVIDIDGQPVNDVWVTARSDDAVASAWTGPDGAAVLFFDAATAGEALLTAGKPDCVPWLGEITVAQEDDFLSFAGYTVGGTFWAGDHDVLLNLHNDGANALPGALATVRTSDPYFTVTDSLSSFGALATGQTVVASDPFSGTLATDTPGDHVIRFDLDITTSWETHCTWFEMPVERVFGTLTHSFSDPAPSEDGTLSLSFTNDSALTASSPLATVECLSADITLLNATTDFGGSIAPGQTATGASDITFHLDSDYVPGAPLTFIVTLESQPEFYQVVHIRDVTFGTSLDNIPTGPDDYGYWIYDSSDVGYIDTPVYDWVEIDPGQGGLGTVHPMTDNDYEGSGDIALVDLPFTFRFYEIGYDQISVSSNGFIMPGDRYSFEWMNWPIPGPMVPRPIIAPFWDDLIIDANSRVCTWYDDANHRFIIEWSEMLNRHDNSIETFQVIIHDPEYNATYLGDSKILFQYDTIANVDQGTYQGFNIDHGEYATVGVGDHTGLRGLQYTCSNVYAPGATPLANELALMVSGPPAPPAGVYVVLGDVVIDDSAGNNNELIDNGESIELNISLRNLGLETATGVSAQLIANDPYITLQQDSAAYPDLVFDQVAFGADDFSFTVANNCPNEHLLNLMLRISSDQGEREVVLQLRTYAPDARFTGHSFTDGNDDQLAPGETGTMVCTFERISYQNLADVVVSFGCDSPDISFDPESVSLGTITDTTFTVTTDISAADGMLNGTHIEIVITVSHDDYYEQSAPVPFIVGVLEQIIFDDFNDGFDDTVWDLYLASLGNDNLAGSTGQEALMIGNATQQQLLVSHIMPAQDIQKFVIDFNHRSIGGGNFYLIVIQEVNTGQIFLPYANTLDMTEPEHLRIEYIPPSSLQQDWILAFVLNPIQPGSEQTWALDDINVSVIRHDPALVTGVVTLNGGDGDVEEVNISTEGQTVHPDETGYYELPLYEGIFNINYTLDGYTMHFVENVNVTYDNPPVIDATLEYLSAPYNLGYELDGESITLTWEYEDALFTRKVNAAQRTQETPRELDYFDVTLHYRDAFFYHAYTTETTYSRDIISWGTYEFWIKARHVGGSMSSESNHVSFEIAGTEGDTPPLVFGLRQNHPNPFNPETTIAFSLASATDDCRLEVYNIRGERVRTLLREPRKAGEHAIVWDGRNDSGAPTASGVYFYRLTAGDKTAIRKAVLLK